MLHRTARRKLTTLLLLAPLCAPVAAARGDVVVVHGHRHHRAVVFHVGKLDSRSIVHATLVHRSSQRTVSTRAVRRAARTGRPLRLRLRHAARRRNRRPFRLRVIEGAGAPSSTRPGSSSSARPGPSSSPAGSSETAAAADAASSTGGPCAVATGSAAHAQAGWRPVGSSPVSDAEAAAAVTPAGESRADNTQANHYCPTDADLALYHSVVNKYGESEANLGSTFNPYHRFVSGRFTGTTDEIIQWAAHKWGIPEDWLRAQYVVESGWRQAVLGDRQTVADPGLYPAAARIGGTSDVFESMGISQVKWRPDQSVGAGTEPLRWESTAFNVDYQASVVRFYYDDPLGHRSNWGDTGYHAGDEWLALSGWYQPSPWGGADQRAYADRVQRELAARAWEKPGF